MNKFIQKLFHPERQPSAKVSIPASPAGIANQYPRSETAALPDQGTAPPNPLDPVQLIYGCSQSIGKQREHNEDSLFILSSIITYDQGWLPFGLFIVADGMGGHQHGEIASGLAVRALATSVISSLYLPLIGLESTPPTSSLQEIMNAGIQEAHRAILDQVPGGGTTLTAVLAFANQITTGHVGDSRAYFIPENGPVQMLTRDHSLVRRLVELGQITVEEAAIHPQRNVLYRALGQGEPLDADINTIQLPGPGSLLLCSDGLWGVIPEADLVLICKEEVAPQVACQRLVKAANDAGGPDNITAILVKVPDEMSS